MVRSNKQINQFATKKESSLLLHWQAISRQPLSRSVFAGNQLSVVTVLTVVSPASWAESARNRQDCARVGCSATTEPEGAYYQLPGGIALPKIKNYVKLLILTDVSSTHVFTRFACLFSLMTLCCLIMLLGRPLTHFSLLASLVMSHNLMDVSLREADNT